MFQTLCSATASTAAAAAALWHTRLTRKLWAVPWSSGKILTWQGYAHRSLASYLHLWPGWLWCSRNFSPRGSTSVYDHVNCFVHFFWLVGTISASAPIVHAVPLIRMASKDPARLPEKSHKKWHSRTRQNRINNIHKTYFTSVLFKARSPINPLIFRFSAIICDKAHRKN